MFGGERQLKSNEEKVLRLLFENKDYSFREIAKLAEINEVSARRLYNKMKCDGCFSTVNLPNYPMLGYKVMMLQSIKVASPFIIQTKKIMKQLMDEWWNCLDCFETYDGRVVIRSVWMNAEDFKEAHADLFRKFGTDWLAEENVEMIPLDKSMQLIRINGIRCP